MANPTKAELLAEAEAKGITVPEGATNKEITELLKAETPAEAPAETEAPTPAQSEGSAIAAAIAEGMKSLKEDKSIKIVADEGVEHRFSLVKNNQGQVLVRENETGRLSEIQLKSIEEKQASRQNQEVSEV